MITELNTEAGIKLDNSVLIHGGRLVNYGNFKGLEAFNSNIAVDVFKARYTQKEAIKLTNSVMKYNKDVYAPYTDGDQVFASGAFLHQVALFENGTHIDLENSKIEPTFTSGMPALYDRFIASGAFGVTQDGVGLRS